MKKYENANFEGQSLRGANFAGYHLRGADFTGCDLYGADFRGAILSNAIFKGAELACTHFDDSVLIFADLRNANLTGADLYYADFRSTRCDNAIFSRANAVGANFNGAYLASSIDPPYIPMVCPAEGSFIAWKCAGDYIVKLEIPADARRSSATGRKCRCDRARVLEIQDIYGCTAKVNFVRSDFDRRFIYRSGAIVEVPDFDNNRYEECTRGIHFFLDRREAIEYCNF